MRYEEAEGRQSRVQNSMSKSRRFRGQRGILFDQGKEPGIRNSEESVQCVGCAEISLSLWRNFTKAWATQ